MGENLHKDNLEDFFKKSFDENDQNSTSDNWDLPDDKVWENIVIEIEEEPTKLVSVKTFAWKKWMSVAASFLVLTIAFCVYQNQQKQLDHLTVKLDDTQKELEKLQENALPDSNKKVILPTHTSQHPKGVAASPKSLFPDKKNTSNSILTEKVILPTHTSQYPKGVASFQKSFFPIKQNAGNTISRENKTVSPIPTDKIAQTNFSNNNNIATTNTNSKTTIPNKILDDKSNLKNSPAAQKEHTAPHIFNNKKTKNTSIASTNNTQGQNTGNAQNKWGAISPLNNNEISLLENDTNFPKVKHAIKHSPAPVIKTRTPLNLKFSLGLVQGFHKISHVLKAPILQHVPSRNHKGQHFAYTTGVAAGIHFNKHFSVESGIAMGIQNSNLRVRGRQHPFPKPIDETELPNGDFESRTNIPYYSGDNVAETDIVTTRPKDVEIRPGTFNMNFHIKNQRQFLRVPLKLKYTSKSFGPAKFTASAGIVGNINLKQEVSIKSQNTDQREFKVRVETNSQPQMKKTSYDFVAGIGLEVPVASNWAISLEPSFSRGLTKAKPEVGSNVTTNMVNVELGARYRF